MHETHRALEETPSDSLNGPSVVDAFPGQSPPEVHLQVPPGERVPRRRMLRPGALRWETRVGLVAVLSFIVVVSAAVAKRGWLSGKRRPETVAAKVQSKTPVQGGQARLALASKPEPARPASTTPKRAPKRGAPPVGSIPPPPEVAEVTIEPASPADRVASPPASLIEGGPTEAPEVRLVANQEVSPPPLDAEALPGLPEEPDQAPPTEMATSEPAPVNLVTTNPAPIEPIAPEPVATESAPIELAANDPVPVEPMTAEPVAAEPIPAEPVTSKPDHPPTPAASQPLGMFADVQPPPTARAADPLTEVPPSAPTEIPQVAQIPEPAAPGRRDAPSLGPQGEPLPHFSTPPTVADTEPATVEPPAAGIPIPNVGVSRPVEKGITLTRGVSSSELAGEGPASRIEPQPHVVQAGENFFTISQRYYRSGRFYKALWKANQDRVPDIRKLYIGTTILVPPPEALDPALVEPAPSVITSTPKPRTARYSNPSAEPALVEPGERDEDRPRRVGPLYTTSDRHETLRSIARRTLGDVYRWPEIRKLNLDVLDDSSAYLPVGTELRLPEDARTVRR